MGFGLYKVAADAAESVVVQALETGYRHIDSAAFYQNEPQVGWAFASILGSEIAREELFVTSKVWNTEQGFEKTIASCERSLEDLRLDYLDLFLIHWPCPERGLFLQTWEALEELQGRGLVRSIGLSNFRTQDIEQVLAHGSVVPAVNQVELHPWLQQRELRELHERHGMVTEGWSPLARGAILQDATVLDIAQELGVSAAQVVLRWHLQEGIVVFPKSLSLERMRANADVFGFELSQAQMQRLNGLERGFRSGSHPDSVN